jgi:FemAB-related protein (PEP-CTERM system-associated)
MNTVGDTHLPLTVKRLSISDDSAHGRWDAFVTGHPHGTFFHLAGWQRVIAAGFRHPTYFLYGERGGRIVGVLPLAHVKSFFFGNALASLPFAVYGGTVTESKDIELALEQEAERIAHELRVDHVEFRNAFPHHPEWPRQGLYVTFRKPILEDVEANMLAIPRKQRAMVRKAIKNGLTGELDQRVDRFFKLFADNVHRHGTPALPRRYFELLLETFKSQCEILTVLDPNGCALSSVLSFRFRDEILPYYAGDTPEARERAANDFKYWEVMRRACEAGCRLFDYGRSKKGTGSYAFKKNWGFEPTPLHYEYRLYRRQEVPQNNPANPKYRALIALWRRLPITFANYIGPLIVRNLG